MNAALCKNRLAQSGIIIHEPLLLSQFAIV
jgi:hypothetical protein